MLAHEQALVLDFTGNTTYRALLDTAESRICATASLELPLAARLQALGLQAAAAHSQALEQLPVSEKTAASSSTICPAADGSEGSA